MLDFNGDFIIETNASGVDIGAVLMQHNRPKAFVSKGFNF